MGGIFPVGGAREGGMRINTIYPSAALLSRVLSTPKEPAEPAPNAPRFAAAMDEALAGQMAVAAMAGVRQRLPARAPETKDPRERRPNDEREQGQQGQRDQGWRGSDQRAQDQRRDGALWA
jgi:hypothetical protein